MVPQVSSPLVSQTDDPPTAKLQHHPHYSFQKLLVHTRYFVVNNLINMSTPLILVS